jgi:hypothetical protein
MQTGTTQKEIRDDVFPMEPSVARPEYNESIVRLQLKKMLQSGAFARSKRARRFLRFAVEQALLGQPEQLKEYSIGLAVFDKPESFDPRMDAIVRVVARRLRLMVKNYYETEGRTDQLVIEFQTGSYAPKFRLRPGSESGEEPTGIDGFLNRDIILATEPATGVKDEVNSLAHEQTKEFIMSQLGLPVLQLSAQNAEEILRRALSGGAQIFVLQQPARSVDS